MEWREHKTRKKKMKMINWRMKEQQKFLLFFCLSGFFTSCALVQHCRYHLTARGKGKTSLFSSSSHHLSTNPAKHAFVHLPPHSVLCWIFIIIRNSFLLHFHFYDSPFSLLVLLASLWRWWWHWRWAWQEEGEEEAARKKGPKKWRRRWKRKFQHAFSWPMM